MIILYAQVCVVEATDQSMRGMLIIRTSKFVSLGTLLVYLLGFLFQQHCHVVAGLCAMLLILLS
jgi:hypothetical protein